MFGGNPDAGLLRDAAGTLFGTADPKGNETVLYSFTGGADGANPVSTLHRDSAGNLYGTAIAGGDLTCSSSGGTGCGTVFKITP
jgi:hypothetical protein